MCCCNSSLFRLMLLQHVDINEYSLARHAHSFAHASLHLFWCTSPNRHECLALDFSVLKFVFYIISKISKL